MNSNGIVLCAALVLAHGTASASDASADREFWVDTMVRIVNPVVTNLAACTLHQNMPRRPKTWTDQVAELEAFGRVMTGLGPWLELPDDETREGRLRAKMRGDVVKALDNITRPGSPDRMPFDQAAAFIMIACRPRWQLERLIIIIPETVSGMPEAISATGRGLLTGIMVRWIMARQIQRAW